MNKITVDLSGIKNRQDTYYEVEVRLSDNEVIHFPKVKIDSDTYYNVNYGNEFADYGGNYICRRNNMYISGKFGFTPIVTDGILYTDTKEVRG